MKNKFPQRLRQLRRERGITQRTLAHQLHYGSTAITNYETGRNEPSYDDLIELADYFEVSTDFLLGRSEKLYPTVDEVWEKLTVAEFLRLLRKVEASPKTCRSFLEKDEKKI